MVSVTVEYSGGRVVEYIVDKNFSLTPLITASGAVWYELTDHRYYYWIKPGADIKVEIL